MTYVVGRVNRPRPATSFRSQEREDSRPSRCGPSCSVGQKAVWSGPTSRMKVLLSVTPAPAKRLVVVAELEARQDGRAFLLHRVETAGIETKQLQNGRRDLCGLNETGHGSRVQIRL